MNLPSFRFLFLAGLISVVSLGTSAACKRTAHQAPEPKAEATGKNPARVFFIEPKDGATLRGPVQVKMGVEGMTVKPAGPIVAGTGHHHILINGEPLDEGTVVPMDATHLHFGKGQTETAIKLKPGKYRLTLQFADGSHKSYGPPLAATINITVQ